MVHRDIELARLTGARIHLLHLSTAGSVELVRAAKADGLPVTAEVAPHHLALTDEALRGYDPVFKVNPPLRTAADVAALKAGLADGTIDAIATDHAPHPTEDKERPIDDAPPGMLGLETALGVGARRARTCRWPTCSPRCRGSRRRSPASATATACRSSRAAPPTWWSSTPTQRWQVRPAALASRSRNTPYAGRELRGRVRHTVFRGEPVVRDGAAQR